MKNLQVVFHLLFCLPLFPVQAQHPDVYRDPKTNRYGYTKNDSVVITARFNKAEPFNGNFAWAYEKGRWGLLDDHGNWTLAPAFQRHQEIEENYHLVKKGRRYGLVSLTSGKVVIPCVYKNPFFFEEFNGFGPAAVVIRKNKAGLVDHSGREIITCQYRISKSPFVEAAPRYYQVKRKKKMGLIDWHGRLIVPCQFDEVTPTDGDTTTISVKRKNKFGIYTSSGKLIVKCQFERSFSFDFNGYGIVKKKGKYGLLNRRGMLILECKYTTEEDVITAAEKIKK